MRRGVLTIFLLLAACGGGVAASTAPAPTSAAALPSAPPAATPPRQADHELVAIDIFGTRQITLKQVLAAYGTELRSLVGAYLRHEPLSGAAELFSKIAALGDFAYVDPSVVEYIEPQGKRCYLTIDFVDRADADRRMRFLPAPTGNYEDPDGLLALWDEYHSKVIELLSSGEMRNERVDCPAFHCLGDSTHPAVARISDELAARVPAHVDELTAILRGDRNEDHRADAAYLLAYSKDGPSVVKALLPAFRDRSQIVRNNAMRVIAEVALYHPEVEVPLDPVLKALDYPATTDRNKAAAILAGLLDQPGAARLRRPIILRAGPTLLAMLRLQQPNNHDFAYRILKALSGKDFGERNYADWDSWLAQARKLAAEDSSEAPDRGQQSL